MWSELEMPWKAALEQAWRAYCAGSVPIGAVIVDSDGDVIGCGRNHIHDDEIESGQICRNAIAHAEINAILACRWQDGQAQSAAIYSTMEPCPLCMGAIYMTGIRQIYYASRDVWAGSTNLLVKTEYLSFKPVRAFPPENANLEAVIIALHTEYMLHTFRNPDHPVFAAWEAQRGHLKAGTLLGAVLRDSGELLSWAKQGCSAEEVLDRLAARLAEG